VNLEVFAFWSLAVVLVGSALAVVLSKNLFHSVLWLALALTGTAGVVLALEAEFLAGVQILLYAGGVVTVDGMDASSEHTSSLARGVGLVFQTPDHQLFERTVRAEMEFGPRNFGACDDAMRGRIASLSVEYGLSGLMDVHPFRLSLGQKRRLNVASVQTMSPKVLLLDEPFIGQDLGSIRALNARLQEARVGGTGILLVSHDLEVMARMVDRALVLEDGRCRELDDPATLEDGVPWGVAS